MFKTFLLSKDELLKPYEGDVQVIGAGVGRTGTLSLREALQILYGSPCYHMKEVLNNGSEYQEFWSKVMSGHCTKEEFKQHFKGYAATCDFPSCVVWKEQMEAFPDAKVILTIRSAESWYASASQTILCMNPYSDFFGIRVLLNLMNRSMGYMVLRFFDKFAGEYQFMKNGGVKNKLKCMQLFDTWNSSIIAQIPSEKLLIFDVKQGWEPLCKFLNKPIPNVPFPNVNDNAEFRRHIFRANTIGTIVGILVLPVTILSMTVFRLM